MAKVKASRHDRLVVKPRQPVKPFLWLVLAVLLIVAAALLGYFQGHQDEREQHALSFGGQQQMDRLKAQLAELKQARLVDQVALQTARQGLKEKQAQIYRLEKSVAFYKGVMAPGDKKKGLHIERLGVEAAGVPRKYRLKWILTQVGANNRYLSGTVQVDLVGRQNGQEKTLSLSELASPVPDLEFKFRYFQSFAVRFDLPKTFTAEAILMTAEAGDKRVNRRYAWQVEEELLDVE